MQDEPRRQELRVDLYDDLVDTTSVTKNLRQEVVVTTRDKIELALHRRLPEYTSLDQLLAAGGLFLAFFAALLTSNFKSFAGIGATAWATVFVIGAIAAAVWTIREFVRWLKRPKMEDLVNEIAKTVIHPTDPGAS